MNMYIDFEYGDDNVAIDGYKENQALSINNATLAINDDYMYFVRTSEIDKIGVNHRYGGFNKASTMFTLMCDSVSVIRVNKKDYPHISPYMLQGTGISHQILRVSPGLGIKTIYYENSNILPANPEGGWIELDSEFVNNPNYLSKLAGNNSILKTLNNLDLLDATMLTRSNAVVYGAGDFDLLVPRYLLNKSEAYKCVIRYTDANKTPLLINYPNLSKVLDKSKKAWDGVKDVIVLLGPSVRVMANPHTCTNLEELVKEYIDEDKLNFIDVSKTDLISEVDKLNIEANPAMGDIRDKLDELYRNLFTNKLVTKKFNILSIEKNYLGAKYNTRYTPWIEDNELEVLMDTILEMFNKDGLKDESHVSWNRLCEFININYDELVD